MKRPSSRRTFLAAMAAGAAAAPAALSGVRPGTTSSPPLPSRATPRDEPYWELVRAQFAFREERVPMNAANLCPSPRSVAARVEELTRDIDRDCSFNNRAKFRDLTEASRTAVAAPARRRPGRDRAGPQHERGQQHHQQRRPAASRRRGGHLGSEPPHQQRRLGGAGGAFRDRGEARVRTAPADFGRGLGRPLRRGPDRPHPRTVPDACVERERHPSAGARAV